jgi:hypothetical protein
MILHIHRGEPFGSCGRRNGSRSLIRRAARRISAALKAMHRAIVAAKLRRLQNELMLHRTTPKDNGMRAEFDAAKFPQRPLMLGDKWDF